MSRSVLEADAPLAMRRILSVFIVLVLCVQVHSRQPNAHCKHKVRTPTKCHDEGTCILFARLTPAANSTLFYCCKQGYQSSNNECVDIDECAATPKPCEMICINHHGSYSCDCQEGFHYVDATASCEETSYCAQLNCSNSCFYAANGPVCDCPRGFYLQGVRNCTAETKICPTNYHMEFDSHTCRVMGEDPQMIFTHDGKLNRYPLRRESEMQKLVDIEGDVQAIYYDSKENSAYLAGEYLTALNFSGKEPVSTKQKLASPALSMAVDYMNGHIYVLDEASLGLWSIRGGEIASVGILLDHNGTMTRLAIDPGNAWLFYTSSGQVVRARLDGRSFSNLFNFYTHVKDEEVVTEVLAVDDMDHNEIFLFYGVNRHIFTFAVDGRRLLWVTDTLPGNVIFMDVFEDFIYYSMEGVDGLTARTKDGLKQPVVYLDGTFLRAMYVEHSARQLEAIVYRCDKPCAQLCFRDVHDLSRCACTRDYILGQDKISCVHVNGTVPDSLPGTPSSQIDALDHDSESMAITTTTVTQHSGFLVVSCVLLVSICVVQFLLIWWFYPRRRLHQGMAASFAARFHDSGSCVTLASVQEPSGN